MRRTAILFSFAVLFVASSAFAQNYQANIDAAQEVPSNNSQGTGLGCFTLNSDNTLDYEVSYSGLSAPETAAHIHGPAAAGSNAGVQFPFALGSPKIGTFGPLTATQVNDLNAGLYYVNIHSTAFPGGEIRGQILATAESCTVAIENPTWSNVKKFYRE